MGTTFSSCGDNCVRKEQLVEVPYITNNFSSPNKTLNYSN